MIRRRISREEPVTCRQLLNRYQGNRRLALAAYNWGMGNLEKRPEALPKETQNYIFRVEKAYNGILNKA